jgi:uncharacterized protein YciI
MFIVLLRFAHHQARAAEAMDGHKQWLQRGFDDGVFLLAGSLQPGLGGALLAHNTTLPALHDRVSRDPFVVEGVVSAEVLEVAPSRVDERLKAVLA